MPGAPAGSTLQCHPRVVHFFHGSHWYPLQNHNYGYDRYYEELGRDWAKELRTGSITWEQLIASVQRDILDAPDQARNDFRRGFLWGYGKEGVSVFTRLMDDARQRPVVQPV